MTQAPTPGHHPGTIAGITEDDIANYLVNTPSFFDRHAELLASVQLASPHGTRAVSLQQRQMEMLRDRIKGLERRIIEMIRNAHENASLVDRLHDWTLTLMLTHDRRALPDALLAQLKHLFLIPHAAVRVWDADANLADAPFVLHAAGEVRQLADSLDQPYCGANHDYAAARWCLGDAEPGATEAQDAEQTDRAIASLALIPLRRPNGTAFGMLVLASPDPTRYNADMGTDLLNRIGEVASASLSRLLPGAATA